MVLVIIVGVGKDWECDPPCADFLIDVDDMFLICNLQQIVTRSHALHSQADMEFPVRFPRLRFFELAHSSNSSQTLISTF